MRPVLTHAEMAEAIRTAVRNVPKLGKSDWKTLYQSLVRERRRVAKLIDEFEENMNIDAVDAGELRMFHAKLRDQLTHINKLMTTLGEQGRLMLISVSHNARLECAGSGQHCARREDDRDGNEK